MPSNAQHLAIGIEHRQSLASLVVRPNPRLALRERPLPAQDAFEVIPHALGGADTRRVLRVGLPLDATEAQSRWERIQTLLQ